MQRPPDRRIPQILFTRATSEWINRVGQKHKTLTELNLSATERERLDRWAEAEFVYSTLTLEGEEITQEQAAKIVSDPSPVEVSTKRDQAALALVKSLRTVSLLAQTNGKTTELSPDLLLEIHNIPGVARGFRSGPGITQGRLPARPEALSLMLDTACQWYTADSFSELNPIEQASIVFLRLLELQPFEQGNLRTALVAASLFTLRIGLPPIVIYPGAQKAYQNALDEGARMNTKPMVELLAESVERTLNGMLERSKKD